jgi:hypothetical protein
LLLELMIHILGRHGDELQGNTEMWVFINSETTA